MPMKAKAPLTSSERVIFILTVAGTIIMVYIYVRICTRAINFGFRLGKKIPGDSKSSPSSVACML